MRILSGEIGRSGRTKKKKNSRLNGWMDGGLKIGLPETKRGALFSAVQSVQRSALDLHCTWPGQTGETFMWRLGLPVNDHFLSIPYSNIECVLI